MGVDHVSQAARVSTKAINTRGLHAAVDKAMEHVTKVQSRMTEELRVEDAIRGLSVHGTEVHVSVDAKYGFKPDGLRDFVKELLAKNGAAGVRVELYTKVDPKVALESANAALQKIHNRLTRETRVEDAIAALTLRPDGGVSVVARPHGRGSEKQMMAAAKELLNDAGLKNVKLTLVIPSIQPIPPAVVVDRAMEAIRQVQGRMTADIRAEDDVLNLSLDGHKDVRVVLGARTRFNDADIKAAVLEHLEAAGFRDANISFIRPAVDPIFIRPPVTVLPPGAVIGTSMKDRVGVFAANIDQVHKRMTEEIRIEDAVVSVKLKGAKVEITIQDGMATSVDSVKQWAKDELKERKITLPVTFKVLDR